MITQQEYAQISALVQSEIKTFMQGFVEALETSLAERDAILVKFINEVEARVTRLDGGTLPDPTGPIIQEPESGKEI